MYTYRPKRRNKTALLLTAVLTLIFASGLICAGFAGSFRYLLEFLSVSSGAGALLIAGRYLLKDYVYLIRENDLEYDFIVVERQGKRRKTVCRIGVSEIKGIVRETPQNRKALSARRKGMKQLNYCVDLGRCDSVYLFLTEDGTETAIRFSPDETLESILKMLSSQGEEQHR